MTTKGHPMTPTERHQAALNHLRKADPHPAIYPLKKILELHAPGDGIFCTFCEWEWPCTDALTILEAVENA